MVVAIARPSGRRTAIDMLPLRRSRAFGVGRLAVMCLALATVCVGRGGLADASADASRASDHDHPEDARFDEGVEEYMLDSPHTVANFLRDAMAEARKAMTPEELAKRKPNYIFPGGVVHDRALKAGRERGILRLAGPPPVRPPALADAQDVPRLVEGGADDAALDASAFTANNATDAGSSLEDEDAPPPSAWGSDDAIGGLLVGSDDIIASSNESELSTDRLDRADDDAAADDARLRRGEAIGAAISSGALANAGALPPPEEWLEASREKLGPLDVAWLVGTEIGEARAAEKIRDASRGRSADDGRAADAASATALSSMNDTAVEEAYAAMHEWFTSKGGRLDGVRLATIPGKPGDGRGLIATEDSPSGTRAIRVPASLTLSSVSSRNLRFKQETVGEQLRSLWVENQERALAVLLLHEWLKEHAGEGSAWGPYLRTLGLPAMGKSALRAVAGTYAAELWAERAADAVDTVSALSSTLCVRAAPLCQKEPGKAASGFHTRDDVRWALGVVRSRAVWVSRRTTGSTFLALVPFLDLVPHHPRAGGSTTLELDTSVGFHLGRDARVGDEISMFRGDASDADALLRWHQVSPGPNPANAVRLKLPGAEVTGAGIIEKVALLRRWRKEMAMPPRGSDLWRGATALGLYGDGDEELEMMKETNSRSARAGRGDGFAALGPVGQGGMTVEEEIMLTGQAATPAIAAEMAAGFVGLSAVPFAKRGRYALYSAPDPDQPGGDDPTLKHAREDLARLALQTQAAATFGEYAGAAGAEDAAREAGDAAPRSDGGDAAAEALEAARDFFERGAPPPRGLDALDLFLLRKGRLMRACGAAREFLLTERGPSPALMCATRVLLANETEVKALEGGGPAPSWTGERDVSGSAFRAAEARGEVHEPFDASRPLSAANERAALKRLATAATNILVSYATTEEEDEEILGGDPFAEHDDDDDDETDETDEDLETIPVDDAETVAEGGEMPRAIRVPGGLVRSAVAFRLREKRLLKSAMRSMAAREATLDELEYQVDEKAREARETSARAEARRLRALELRRAYAVPRNLSSVAVDVVTPEEKATEERPAGARTETLTIREGDDADALVRAFVAAHALDASAVELLLDALGADSAKDPEGERRTLVAAVPVIVPAGTKAVLAVREGDDVDELARTFADLHEIPDGIVPGLAKRVNETVARRLARPLLLRLPVTAPDLRRLRLDVRDGEQHDLARHASEWAAAERVSQGAVGQVADAAFARLSEVLVAFPVDVPGRARLTLHVRTRDESEVRSTVEAFVEVNDLDRSSTLPLTRMALSRLNHGSILIDVDPPKSEEGDSERKDA